MRGVPTFVMRKTDWSAIAAVHQKDSYWRQHCCMGDKTGSEIGVDSGVRCARK
jgi:hypothetical protein